MSDIVERLRRWEVSCDMKEARDTITALRADLAARDAEVARLRTALDRIAKRKTYSETAAAISAAAIARAELESAAPAAPENLWREPTDDEVGNACMSYRHDFGLMSAEERTTLVFQAKEWLHAWRKAIDMPLPPETSMYQQWLEQHIPPLSAAVDAAFAKAAPSAPPVTGDEGDELAALREENKRLRDALEPILNYPGIRTTIGSILHDAGLAALASLKEKMND